MLVVNELLPAHPECTSCILGRIEIKPFKSFSVFCGSDVESQSRKTVQKDELMRGNR